MQVGNARMLFSGNQAPSAFIDLVALEFHSAQVKAFVHERAQPASRCLPFGAGLLLPERHRLKHRDWLAALGDQDTVTALDFPYQLGESDSRC